MNILHIIPKFPVNEKLTTVGGSANSLLNLAKQQMRSGDQAEILSHFPLISKSNEEFLRQNRYRRISIYSAPNSKFYGAEFIFKAASHAMFSKQKYEIVHGHSGHIDYLLASKLVSGIFRSHLVYSLYCPLKLDSLVTRYPLRQKYLEIISKAVTFIAISENIAGSLDQLDIDKNVVIIPPAVNIEKYTNVFDKAEIRQRHSYRIDQPVILFVGNFTKTKNMECVLLAFSKFLKQFPSAKLIITTELKMKKFSDREEYLEKLIEDLDIYDSLVFKGVIDNMPELMQLSDVLIAPFRDTDGPSDYYLAALEAMSVGTPVFVSPVGGMKEVVNQSNGKYIDPEQPDQLHTELVEYFSNQSAGQEMGANAAKYIRQNFAPEIVENKVKDIYRMAINNEN